ncbi:hypothetical protein V9K67_20555 [Paraflavisolibacter sp. H34]|uniref:hypothetical protein n=1 Tax=Huijunlia imazamoxiresistens TaxID=3127457 RepID=UPI00301B1D61
MRTPALLLVFFLFCRPLAAQMLRLPVTAAYLQGGGYSRAGTDVFAFRSNQAALAHLQQLSAGLFAERRFGLQELSSLYLAAAFPSIAGNFGLNATYAGSADNNELQAGLAYGRKLGARVAAGLQFNYYTVGISGYGRAASVNAEAGVLLLLSERLQAGVQVYNPARSRIGKRQEERLPASYSLGLGYDASDQLSLSGRVEKTDGQPVDVQAVLQYRFDGRLLARGGVATAAALYFFGAGLQWYDLQLHATASVHPRLGVTPGLLLIFKNPDAQ